MRRLSAALPSPDFLRPERPARLASWLWLATAVAVLLTAALDAFARHQDRAAAAAALQARQDQLARLQRPERARPQRPATMTDAETRLWQQRLQHPWPAVLVASEQAAEAGLSWLSWRHDVQGRLQLEGLADDPHAVLAALARLQARPAALRSAGPSGAPALQDLLLTRMEAVDGGWRFTLQARGATEGPRS